MAVVATITARHLRHAVTHRKDCDCYDLDERDPRCEEQWPNICPWHAYQLHRHATGDFSSPGWWAYQQGLTDSFSDQAPDPREFDAILAPRVDLVRMPRQ